MREPLAARKAPARARRPQRSRPGCCTDSGGWRYACAQQCLRSRDRTPGVGQRAAQATAVCRQLCPHGEPRFCKPGGELNTGCDSALILDLGQVADFVKNTKCSCSAISRSCRGI